MAASNVRNILLRALFEPSFHNLLLTDPDAAIRGYDLDDKEISAIKNPSQELYSLIAPTATDRALSSMNAASLMQVAPPTTTTTTTITVYIVVAITVFVAAIAPARDQQPDLEIYRPLIDAIRRSSGPARIDLVKTLVNELTRES